MRTDLSALNAMPTLPTLVESRTPSAYDPLAPHHGDIPCLCSPAWRCEQHTLLSDAPGGAPRQQEDYTVACLLAIIAAGVCGIIWGLI